MQTNDSSKPLTGFCPNQKPKTLFDHWLHFDQDKSGLLQNYIEFCCFPVNTEAMNDSYLSRTRALCVRNQNWSMHIPQGPPANTKRRHMSVPCMRKRRTTRIMHTRGLSTSSSNAFKSLPNSTLTTWSRTLRGVFESFSHCTFKYLNQGSSTAIVYADREKIP